jgi:DNA-binding CsgD family transcriptional regulator
MATITQRKLPDMRAASVCGAGFANTLARGSAVASGVRNKVPVAGGQGLEWARAAVGAYALLGLPAAVLSRSHRLVTANELMQVLIPRVVQDRPSRIGLADRRADAMLAQLLQQMHAEGRMCSVPIAATSEMSASIVHVIPVRDAPNDMFAAACMLVIAAVVRPAIASVQLIQDLFDITPAEARVARGIAAGKTVRDLAVEAGVSAGTIRQHLKSVFSKTGVSRQADLVGILVGSALSFSGRTGETSLAGWRLVKEVL